MNTVLELVVDFSLSMGPYKDNTKSYLLPDGSTRMSLAKSALVNVIIPILDYTGSIGIRTFYSKGNKPIIDTVYEGEFEKNIVISKIQSFTDPIKTGGTPISAALQSSIDFLRKSADIDRKIILVTDGEETDGGDFKLTAENGLKDHQIKYNIFIIGIGQNDVIAAKCKLLAESTHGGYVNLETANYDKQKLSSVLRPLSIKAVSSSIENVHERNRKVISGLKSHIANVNADVQGNIEYNDEIVKVLTGLARSIELINKQLINLDEDIKSVDKSMKSVSGHMTSLSMTSDIRGWLEGMGQNNIESLNKVYNKIDQVDMALHKLVETFSLQDSSDFKSIDENIRFMKNQMVDMLNVGQLIDGKISQLLSKQLKRDRKLRILLVLMFIVLGILSYLVLKEAI